LSKRTDEIEENTFYHLLDKCRDVTSKHKFGFKAPKG